MSKPKDLGTLHMCRNSHITIKTPDHKDSYMVVLGNTGNLSFLKAATSEQHGVVFTMVEPEKEIPDDTRR